LYGYFACGFHDERHELLDSFCIETLCRAADGDGASGIAINTDERSGHGPRTDLTFAEGDHTALPHQNLSRGLLN
jgi:hypothetical protein